MVVPEREEWSEFGKVFRLRTRGTSHGPRFDIEVYGCPAGVPVDKAFIDGELAKRKPGIADIYSQRREEDVVEILEGIVDGKTTGDVLRMFVKNTDARPEAYDGSFDRPGHADYTRRKRYYEPLGLKEIESGGGKLSGRETLCRVAGGAVAQKYLETKDVHVIAYLREIRDEKHSVSFRSKVNWQNINPENILRYRERVYQNPVHTLENVDWMQELILGARKNENSLGGLVEVAATGVPAGLGEPVFDKINADMAKALMSIPTAKAVEQGAGIKVVGMRGSQYADQFNEAGKISSNNAGGTWGGMTNGQPLVFRVYLHAPVSIPSPLMGRNAKAGKGEMRPTKGRHDPCIATRAVRVVQAMAELVIADHELRWRNWIG